MLLVGGGALAQQGFIVEPWRRATPAPTPVELVPRSLPASGLPNPAAVVAPLPAKPAVIVEAPVPSRWSPPVIELLVDPWAKKRLAAPSSPSRWAPEVIEIVDPWAEQRLARPHVANRSAGSTPVPIF